MIKAFRKYKKWAKIEKKLRYRCCKIYNKTKHSPEWRKAFYKLCDAATNEQKFRHQSYHYDWPD